MDSVGFDVNGCVQMEDSMSVNGFVHSVYLHSVQAVNGFCDMDSNG